MLHRLFKLVTAIVLLQCLGVAPASRPTSQPIEPKFFGSPLDAGSVMFVCDASGSMLFKLPKIKEELLRAIRRLPASQRFNVIFFRGDLCLRADDRLRKPDVRFVKQVEQLFARVKAFDDTNPIRAVEMAFKERPEVIYFITDGDFPDSQALLAKVRALNGGDRKVTVNVIGAVSETPPHLVDALKQIATENGGRFIRVLEDERYSAH